MTNANQKANPLPANLRNSKMTVHAMRIFFRGIGTVTPRLGGKLAYNLWFSPRRRKPRRRPDFLDGASRKLRFEVMGKQVSAWVLGEGPAVLMVHGWEGRTTQFRQLTAALLEQGFKVVLFDLPAHGESEGKQTDAEEIRAAMMELERLEGPFHSAITHSFGAVPLAFAAREGLKLQNAVMINPPSRFRSMLGLFQKQLSIPERAMANMRGRIERRLPHLGEGIWQAIDTEANAAVFDFPGMVISDEDDTVVPASQGKLIARAWPGAQLKLTRGLGHSRILKDPEVIDEVVRQIRISAAAAV